MNSLNRLIQLAKVTILAQLLPPKEFGLLGIGFLILAVFESFSQLGIDTALIQKVDENVDRYLDTAWILQICRGLVLTSVIFLLAPYGASWFGEPRATNVIRTLGVGPLLLGLKNPGTLYFRKNLQFHLRFMQILSGSVVNFITAVSLGILLGNVWALVGGSIVGNIVSVIVSYRLHEYRPGLKFQMDLAKDLVDFGKWVFGNSIVRFLQNQGDDIVVGSLLGATPLAFYQMAYRFSNAPATELTSVINKVTFPSLAQVQDNSRKLRNGYFRTLRFSVFLAFPVATGIALVAPYFVRIFLGTDWLATIPILQTLAIWGAIRALDSPNRPVWHTLTRPDLVLKLTLTRVILIAIGILPATNRYGLIGVAGTIIISAILAAPVGAFITLKMINGSPKRYLLNIIHPLTGSIIMAVILLQLGALITFASPIIKFISFILAGVIVYLIYMILAVSTFNYRIKEDIKTIFGSV